MTLTANGVTVPPGATLTGVSFYRESNVTPGLQAGSDTLLGTDAGSPYSLAVSTGALVAGTYTYYALATANTGALSNMASRTNTISGTPPAPGSIAGRMWDDVDADGLMESNEHGMFDYQVYLDTNHNGLVDAGEPNTRTNTSGQYSFAGLAPGTYQVREVLRAGWRQTQPLSGVYVVNVASGQAVTGINLGNTQLPNSTVANRQMFYNNSFYDRRDATANTADDGAIATNKSALLPGGGRAMSANVSSYDKGINGLMIDVAGLPAGTGLGSSDFSVDLSLDGVSWNTGPSPTISVRRQAGANLSDRITLIWPDNSIKNMWLRLTVKVNAYTGLAAPAISYFGSSVGDTGNAPAGATSVAVDVPAYFAVRDHLRSYDNLAPVTWNWDLNRDGVTDGLDLQLVRMNATSASMALQLIPVPQATAAVQSSVIDTEAKPEQTLTVRGARHTANVSVLRRNAIREVLGWRRR